MSIQQFLNLPYTADVSDPATRMNLRTVVMPRLERERDELAACRQQCAVVPSWADQWSAAGMITLERDIEAAVARIQTLTQGHHGSTYA